MTTREARTAWVAAPIWIPLLVGLIAGGVVAIVLVSGLGNLSGRQNRVCDKAVDMLLHSKDLADVYRAGVLVHEIDCAISRRATDWARPQ
jgi:hypothetical protein